jgi:type 2A phosphatase activator TIP41
MSQAPPSSAAIPQHEVIEKSDGQVRTIKIFSWEITVSSTTISNSKEIDDMQENLGGLPIPEMPFGNNWVELYHVPSGWKYLFRLQEALAAVKLGELEEGDGGVKVGYAKAWMQSR